MRVEKNGSIGKKWPEMTRNYVQKKMVWKIKCDKFKNN